MLKKGMPVSQSVSQIKNIHNQPLYTIIHTHHPNHQTHQHVGRARLDLRVEDGKPQVLGPHLPPEAPLPLVARVELLEGRAVAVAES